MKKTKNLGLNLPEMGDVINIEDINENSMKLDSLTAEQVGAAPAGFGLGKFAGLTLTTQNEVDNALKSGWYHIKLSVGSIMGFNELYMRVDCGHIYCIQTFYAWFALYGGYTASVRVKYDGSWKPLEYITPPMLPGVEYRTTERYNGRPVFAQLFDAGGFDKPGVNKEFFLKDASSGIADTIVSATAMYNGYKLPTKLYGGKPGLSDDSGTIYFEISADSHNGLYCFKATPKGGRDLSVVSTTVKVFAKYTKVGDK